MPPILPFLATAVAFISFVSLTSSEIIAVVLAHSRSSALKRTLRSLPPSTLPLYVSVDDNPKASRAVRAAHFVPSVTAVWHHIPSPVYPANTPRERIARHYHFVLSTAFANTTATHVILLEDDLHLAPDALAFFQAAASIVGPPHRDAVVCASAWNDNPRQLHADPTTASLTTFFPGLGWMLARSFWEHFLRDAWPGAPAAPAGAVVGIGWDFWLRVQFERHGWACVTPDVPRVRHFGVQGANVGAHETAAQFAQARLANVPPAQVDWEAEVGRLAQPAEVGRAVQRRLSEGHMVATVEEARAFKRAVMPYRRETFMEGVANALQLWPSPRGHFRHTLKVSLGEGNDVLLYDKRRAAKFFKLPGDRVPLSGENTGWRYEYGAKNASCDETCEARGTRCTPTVLEEANSCDTLSSVVPDGCSRGCAYETGADLPVRVEDDAPLQTASLCLIAETGTSVGGSLDCGGRYAWTRRVCSCLGNGVEKSGKDEL